MSAYIPERGEIVWLNFEPTKGREIGKYRPALVLSSRQYNQQTNLLICCPVSTSIRGAATEVPVNNLGEPSVVAANLIQALSWRERHVKFAAKAEPGVFEQVVLRVLPLMGAEALIS